MSTALDNINHVICWIVWLSDLMVKGFHYFKKNSRSSYEDDGDKISAIK